MMNDNDEDDDYSNDYSQDVPTDEEEEDRQYQEHSYNPTEFQEQPRVTPPSILLLPTIVTPTMIMVPTTHNTPPPRSPRTRRFTSLPLHLEESLARDSAATRSRSTTSSTFPTFRSSDHPTHSPFSGGMLESQIHAPRPRRAGCSRVLLVLAAYVGLMVFPRPPLLHMRVWSPHAGVVSTFPRLENEFIIIAPTKEEKVAAAAANEQMQNTASEQQQQSVAVSTSQDAPQPKRRLRQPSLAHARTNRQRTVFYGGKPNASLLFLEHMEETPLQQRTLPRFFFSTSKNNGAANAAGRRSFFKKDSEHSDDQQQQQQQHQHWLWWILYKVAWLILLGCTLEAGVREIPRRFHTWTGLWFHPSLHRINSSAAMNGASASSRHFDPSSSPPLLSRAFSTPRRRRG